MKPKSETKKLSEVPASIARREWYALNKARALAINKKWRDNNKSKCQLQKKRWHRNNRDYQNARNSARQHTRYTTDEAYRLQKSLYHFLKLIAKKSGDL